MTDQEYLDWLEKGIEPRPHCVVSLPRAVYDNLTRERDQWMATAFLKRSQARLWRTLFLLIAGAAVAALIGYLSKRGGVFQ